MSKLTQCPSHTWFSGYTIDIFLAHECIVCRFVIIILRHRSTTDRKPAALLLRSRCKLTSCYRRNIYNGKHGGMRSYGLVSSNMNTGCWIWVAEVGFSKIMISRLEASASKLVLRIQNYIKNWWVQQALKVFITYKDSVYQPINDSWWEMSYDYTGTYITCTTWFNTGCHTLIVEMCLIFHTNYVKSCPSISEGNMIPSNKFWLAC